MSKETVTILKGKVRINPWGDWSDVDKGVYVGDNRIDSEVRYFNGSTVKITIEIIDDEE